jgi:CheY-like chemotaxis protein
MNGFVTETGGPPKILMVEDSPSDVRLTVEAMKESRTIARVSIVGDGQAAIDFLLNRPPFEQAPRPDLILLDLNLPKRSGHEVLLEIKSVEHLKSIPVIVLTTSKAQEDIARTYQLHANCFITKPCDMDSFIAVVQQIENFWFSVVKLPQIDD